MKDIEWDRDLRRGLAVVRDAMRHHEPMVWWMTSGLLLEGLGMALTAFGLFRTWKANARGRPFFPARVRRLTRRLLRRPPRIAVGSLNAVAPAATGRFFGYSSERVDPEAPIEEQIAALATSTERAQNAATQAAAQIAAEAHERAEAVARLRRELHQSRDQLTAHSEDLAVGGIPMAVTGLALVALGFLVQAGASTYSLVFG